MPGSDLYSILAALDRGALTRQQATRELESLGAVRLQRHLAAAGLTGETPPSEAATLADMLLALHRPAEDRAAGARTLRALVDGTVFQDDRASLRGRYAVPRPGGLDVLALHAGDGAPRLVKDLTLSDAEITDLDRVPVKVPPGDVVVLPDDLHIPPTPIEVVDHYHYKVDIKLVLWIPYRGNSFPIPTRFMPGNWERTPGVTQEMRTAGRAMLATGNPTPPDSFTRDTWRQFVADQEYRGYLWRQLYICCPEGTDKSSRVVGQDAGYTPAPSNVPERELHQFHTENQNAGSIAADTAAGPSATALDVPAMIPGKLVPKHTQLGGRVLRRHPPPPNESFSKGELICPPQVLGADCISGTWEFWVHVGRSHNLVNYMLTNKLISYQGGVMTFKLCCDGKLSLSYQHTALPSWKLYVNNQVVHTYDMLTASWAEVDASFYEPLTPVQLTQPVDKMVDALEAALNEQRKAPKVKHWEDTYTPPRHDGCPGLQPDEWIDERL